MHDKVVRRNLPDRGVLMLVEGYPGVQANQVEQR